MTYVALFVAWAIAAAAYVLTSNALAAVFAFLLIFGGYLLYRTERS